MNYVPESVKEFLRTEVSLHKLELVVIELPQVKPFRSAIGVRLSRKALIVKWHTLDGVIGYGECSCRPDPFYSHEFVEGAVQVIQNYVYPLLHQAKSYGAVLNILEKIRGWPFTKAAVEFAMNDAIRRTSSIGVLEVWQRPRLDKVPVGISLGLFEDGHAMKKAMDEAVEHDYQRLKFKISPSYTESFVFENIVSSTHPNISFDANGSFNSGSFEKLKRFSDLGYVIEQPFPPANSYFKSEFENQYGTLKVCLDEEIETLGQLIDQKNQLVELNIKPGRVGGLVKTIEMIEYCFENSIAAWIGGMFETGIGRALNLQIASFLVMAKAHDQSPSTRYFKRDVLVKPIEMDKGFIHKSDFSQPQVNETAFQSMTVKSVTLSK